ncbi:MAG TPA: hypothetical protein VLU41_01700 [Ideonella sp.]|nr:hypothetical protein [Ideonella sp.]
MVRGISMVLAVGLVVLWIVGLGQHSTAWLTWLDGLAALFGFAVAAGIAPGVTRAAAAGAPISLAVGLASLWIIGLATHAAAWLTWWTFAFSVAYLLVGISAGAQRQVPTVTRPRMV